MRARKQRLPKKAKVTWEISVIRLKQQRSLSPSPVLSSIADKITRCAENRAWRAEHYMVADHVGAGPAKQYRCKLLCCPYCQRQHVKKRIDQAVDGFGRLNAQDITFITINGDEVNTLDEVDSQHQRMRKWLQNQSRTTLKGYLAWGMLELDWNWEWATYRPHWHIILGRSDRAVSSMEQVKEYLTHKFPGHRQIDMRRLRSANVAIETERLVIYCSKLNLEDFRPDKVADVLGWLRQKAALRYLSFSINMRSLRSCGDVSGKMVTT